MTDKRYIENYLIIKPIGKGGMGEVFLAYDPVLKRHIALKKIRDDISSSKIIQNRFLREAKIASSLTHPSIIPIYSINQKDPIYYTMPFIEGETFKELLLEEKSKEKKGKKTLSINHLTRIFLTVCEAIYYSHSKDVLHRDLKPDNIFIGKFGEVLIFDWGIATYISNHENDEETRGKEFENLTRPGKLAGTLAFMPPERAFGKKANASTDIYALGVILYQILTFSMPFLRPNIATFKKIAKLEKFLPPTEKAPYRDIPHELSHIAMKCLSYNPKDRYTDVKELINDLKNFIEGKPQWVLMDKLNINKKEDWKFHEHVLFSKNLAISKNAEVTDWVSMMVSKEAFSENVKLESEVFVGRWGNGIGFLINIPEQSIHEGYCIWLTSKKDSSSYVLRSNVIVMELSDIYLTQNTWHKIRIEKTGPTLKCFLDNLQIFSYVSHWPLSGTHVGTIYKDSDFILKDILISSGSHNVTINCLAVADAFLTRKDFDAAIFEYMRISKAFPGRSEGREAQFRLGLALIKKAKTKKGLKEKIITEAIDEFSKLHSTPSEPLEYLGKAIAFENLKDFEEEAKCLELAIRKFKTHPLSEIIKEHIIYRLHECSLTNREATFRLSLISILFLQDILKNPDTFNLIDSLKKNIEIPVFFDIDNFSDQTLSIILSFLLSKPLTLCEIITKGKLSDNDLFNALFSLLELKEVEKVNEILNSLKNKKIDERNISLIKTAVLATKIPLDKSFKKLRQITKNNFDKKAEKVLIFILEKSFDKLDFYYFDEIFDILKFVNFSTEDRAQLDSFYIKYLLLKKDVLKLQNIFSKFPQNILQQENSKIHFLYGCYLFLKKGKEFAYSHFSNILEVPYPPTTSLISHYLTNTSKTNQELLQNTFYWEKRELFRNLTILYGVFGNSKKQKHFLEKLKEE